jgi:hypothetical protein
VKARAGHSFGFTIESVTRGVGARAVPEPGTQALMIIGLAGSMLVRRRTLVRAAR